MFNKIYAKIKKFLKENYKILVVFLIILISFNIELDYEILSSGGLINIDDRVKVNNVFEERGSFNLTYVTARKGLLPNVILSYIISSWDLVPLEESRVENESYDEIIRRNQVYLEEGNNNAVISAFNEAGVDYEIKNNKVKVLYVLDESKSDILPGDEILEVNAIKINSLNSFKNEIEKYNAGDIVSIKVIRDEKEKILEAEIIMDENEKIIGLLLVNIYDIDTKGLIDIVYKRNETGSSGGLMTALYIYNAITDYDLTRGLKIAGTGTIDEEGTIGKISGIKYKLLGAEKNNAFIFLVPSDNYEEAKKVKKENKLKIDLIEVFNLNEAINKIKEYNLTK